LSRIDGLIFYSLFFLNLKMRLGEVKMFFLFISGTEISKIPGLSAAGANPDVLPLMSLPPVPTYAETGSAFGADLPLGPSVPDTKFASQTS
jgi:NaMN:DMB phosphoribosyltransferase